MASDLQVQLAQTPAPRGTKQCKVRIESSEDVDAFRELVRVKWEFGKAADDSSVRTGAAEPQVGTARVLTQRSLGDAAYRGRALRFALWAVLGCAIR